jgi:microcompartment protein CcmK/EutM
MDGQHPLDWPYDGIGVGVGRWVLPPTGSAVSSLTLAARDALSSVHA